MLRVCGSWESARRRVAGTQISKQLGQEIFLIPGAPNVVIAVTSEGSQLRRAQQIPTELNDR